MQDDIVIAEYDPAWPRAFEEERAAIEGALGGARDGVVAIEHVGSTAVPGLAAKPIIDIMIGVRGPADGVAAITPIVGLGYDCMGEFGIPGRIYFRKGRPTSHHIHLVEHGLLFWERHLAFRDALRAHGGLADEYAALKRELARRHAGDRPAYTEAKSPFIQRVIAERLGTP